MLGKQFCRRFVSSSVVDVVLFGTLAGGGEALDIVGQSLDVLNVVSDVTNVLSSLGEGDDVVDTVSDFGTVVQLDLGQEGPLISITEAANQDVVEALGNGVPVFSDVLGSILQVLELGEGILILVDGVEASLVLVDFRADVVGSILDVLAELLEGEAVGGDQKDSDEDDSFHLYNELQKGIKFFLF